MVGLTELNRVQCGDVTAERLHREDGDLVADISGGRPAPWSAGELLDCSVGPSGGNARYSPRDNLRILSAHLSVCLCAYIGWVGRYWGWTIVCSWGEEGASPYMTGNSEDASLWDWQIG